MKTPSHNCDKSADIAVIKNQVEALDHVINGNGKKGLRDEVTVLIESTEGLRNDLNEFRTVVSGIKNFMAGLEGERRESERMKIAQRWIIGTLLVVITVLFGSGVLN